MRRDRSFFLAGHRKPDGDTIGSGLALVWFLKSLGKKAEIYSQDPIPKVLQFLPGIGMVRVGQKTRKKFDTAILLECSTPDRFGDILDLKSQVGTIIHIDHHKTSVPYGHINLIHPEASSNAEQVYEILRLSGRPVTPEMAACLYVGLATDTGRFQYSNTSPRTLRVAAELMETGIKAYKINERLFATKPLSALKLLSLTLGGLELHFKGKAAVQTISRGILKRAQASMEDSEEIVNYGLTIPGTEVAILFKEEPGRIFVSFRSRDEVDVSAVAQKFGGGGHHKAAGCQLALPLEKARRMVLKEVKKRL